MKQNVSETGSNWRFRKNVKTCLQNKKSYLMPLSRHGHFYPILSLHLKIVKLPKQNASTTTTLLTTMKTKCTTRATTNFSGQGRFRGTRALR